MLKYLLYAGRERFGLATLAAETRYNLWELEYRKEELNLDMLMQRLKDLAYFLTHAEIMEQREGVELVTLRMLFCDTSIPQCYKNHKSLKSLLQSTIEYQGQSEIIKQEIDNRKTDINVKHKKAMTIQTKYNRFSKQ